MYSSSASTGWWKHFETRIHYETRLSGGELAEIHPAPYISNLYTLNLYSPLSPERRSRRRERDRGWQFNFWGEQKKCIYKTII
jgi:hypothetical protein